MTSYITCRPLIYRKEIISPKECLKNNFPELNFEFRCIASNKKIDGRWLYEIEINDDYSKEEKGEVLNSIITGLQAFGATKETLTFSKTLIDKLTNKKCKSKDGKIVIPNDDKNMV